MSARRHMARSMIARVAVFLLLGAVVNVAVAWGCAIDVYIGFIDPSARVAFPVLGGSNFVQEKGSGATRIIYERRAGQRIDMQRFRDLPSWVLQAMSGQANVDQHTALVLEGRGWPWLAMYSVGDYMANEVRFGLDLRTTNDPTEFYTAAKSFTLPLAVIWPGFAFNTLFYAVILRVLYFLSRRLLRFGRASRGLCAKCAYPVGTSEVCTECGASISKKHR